jgi:hypothetical protein
VHPAVAQATRPQPAATGVDYLGLVQAAHEQATGTGAPIDYARLAKLASGDTDQDRQREPRR